jgi:hypothetical protein
MGRIKTKASSCIRAKAQASLRVGLVIM